MAREAIEQRLKRDAELDDKLRFHWVSPPDRIDPWKGDVPGKRVWHRLLLHYQLWQRYAGRVGKELAESVDVAQHVTFGNIFLKTFVTELRLPYIIGPVGGGQAPPPTDALRLLARTRDVHGGLELVRSVLVRGSAHRPALRRRLGNAVAVLCANSQTLAVARRFQQRSQLMIDGGITTPPSSRAKHDSVAPVVLWVGKMEARKDPLAALDVADELRKVLPKARLLMIGDGWLHDRVAKAVLDRHLEDVVELKGAIPHEQMGAVYAGASTFLFTSQRDTFGVQNLEAMTQGLPIVFRAGSGVGVDDFARGSAVAVQANDRFASQAAQRIARLAATPAEWQRRSDEALREAAAFTWAEKARRVVELFATARERGVGALDEISAGDAL
jgi:glycosyltransferase involved in cell wall biosynthesis